MIEILVCANVVDDAMYTAYRSEMTPLLEAHGGSFVVDVRIGEVLRLPVKGSFNRLFTICFPSVERLESFFSNERYLEIRKRLFEPSVAALHQIAKYEVLPSP